MGELQEQAAKRHGTTIDSLTAELEKARETEMDTGQVSAAVSAIMGKAKLHGLLVEKIHGVHNVKRIADDYTDDELLEIIAVERRAARRTAARQEPRS